MSVTAIGFIPAAPLLVPQVAGGSADLDAELRTACRDVAGRLTAAADNSITVVGSTGATATLAANPTWGFEGFGVPRQPADPRARLPWQIGIGDWLLDDIGWSGERGYIGIGPDQQAQAPAKLTDALLIIGDGSARRTEKAPGHLDDRAAPFDESIAAAIRTGDLAALGGFDVALAADLLCAGAPVWRWLADALPDTEVGGAELLADTAPYGVGYFAGYWRLKP